MYRIKLTKELINSIEKESGLKSYIFDFDKIEIPTKLRHENLLNSHFNISEYIESYYFKTTEKCLNDSEFKEWQNKGYIGRKLTALLPYSIIINGAYYFRTDLGFKFYTIVSQKKYRLTIQNKEIVCFDDLVPYFKEYNKGFENGFKNFENEYLKDFLPMFADKTDFANQIFQFITLTDKYWNSWLNNVRGFLENLNNNEISIKEAYNNGLKNGYYYKAWSLIFTNSHLFDDLFENLNKELNPPAPEKIKEPEKINSTKKEPTAPAKALFCRIVNEATDLKYQNNASKYSKEVCEKYKLKDTNVRNHIESFMNKKTNDIDIKYLNMIKELILPNIRNYESYYKIESELNKLIELVNNQN